jgi:hypothetical protein
MMTELTIITIIVMLGILCSVIAWQVFAVGKTAVKKDAGSPEMMKKLDSLQKECREIRGEISALNSRFKDPGQA